MTNLYNSPYYLASKYVLTICSYVQFSPKQNGKKEEGQGTYSWQKSCILFWKKTSKVNYLKQKLEKYFYISKYKKAKK